MTTEDVQNMFKLRFDDAGKQVYMLPQDVIDNTILAFNVSPTRDRLRRRTPTGRYFAPANGPDCIEIARRATGAAAARSLIINGPPFQQHDIRFSKRTRIVGTANLEFAAQMLNAFNHANFLPVNGTGRRCADYEVTTLTGSGTRHTSSSSPLASLVTMRLCRCCVACPLKAEGPVDDPFRIKTVGGTSLSFCIMLPWCVSTLIVRGRGDSTPRVPRASFGQELQHLLLAIGQQVIRVGGARAAELAHVVFDQHGAHRQ